jgi:hypothetical protein
MRFKKIDYIILVFVHLNQTRLNIIGDFQIKVIGLEAKGMYNTHKDCDGFQSQAEQIHVDNQGRCIVWS